jgi:hypothetical protein
VRSDIDRRTSSSALEKQVVATSKAVTRGAWRAAGSEAWGRTSLCGSMLDTQVSSCLYAAPPCVSTRIRTRDEGVYSRVTSGRGDSAGSKWGLRDVDGWLIEFLRQPQQRAHDDRAGQTWWHGMLRTVAISPQHAVLDLNSRRAASGRSEGAVGWRRGGLRVCKGNEEETACGLLFCT